MWMDYHVYVNFIHHIDFISTYKALGINLL